MCVLEVSEDGKHRRTKKRKGNGIVDGEERVEKIRNEEKYLMEKKQTHAQV